jgi:hypothetical protein
MSEELMYKVLRLFQLYEYKLQLNDLLRLFILLTERTCQSIHLSSSSHYVVFTSTVFLRFYEVRHSSSFLRLECHLFNVSRPGAVSFQYECRRPLP